MAECVHKGPGCQKRAGVHINGSKGYTGVSYCHPCASGIFTEPEWNAILIAMSVKEVCLSDFCANGDCQRCHDRSAFQACSEVDGVPGACSSDHHGHRGGA